jgi:iron complex transport system ATP-binding protein
MKKILYTENLNIGYSTKKSMQIIAQNLNLRFEQGKLISLIGVNGIGKSTLLKTLTGIMKPISGTVFLNDLNINKMKINDIAKNLSLVLTEKLPPSNLTVFELVALGRQPYTNWIGKLTTDDLNKINWAIDLTDIAHLQDKKHFEISDGQLQKVLIARALAQDTPLIILDEPTTHLDLLHKVSLLKLLKKLSIETQKCILFSTHDIDLAIQLSDEMVVMTAAKIYQDKPNNLIENGIFNQLFNNENIVFNKSNAKFEIK